VIGDVNINFVVLIFRHSFWSIFAAHQHSFKLCLHQLYWLWKLRPSVCLPVCLFHTLWYCIKSTYASIKWSTLTDSPRTDSSFNGVRKRSTRVVWAHIVWINTVCNFNFFTFFPYRFFNTRTARDDWQTFTINTPKCVFSRKEVPFGDLEVKSKVYGSIPPPKKKWNFGGGNRRCDHNHSQHFLAELINNKKYFRLWPI